MPVVLLLAAVAILVAVVIVAWGRGGEMAAQRPDYPVPDLGPVTAADVALLRPPSAAWGYNRGVTDEALERIAQAIQERDVQIATLQRQVADLRESQGASMPPPQRAAPGQDVPGQNQAAAQQRARDTAGQAQAGQDQQGQGQAERPQDAWDQDAWDQDGRGQEGGGRAAGESPGPGRPVLQGRVVPRQAAGRPPPSHGETPGSAQYGPAPRPPGSRGYADWQQEPGE